MKEKLYRVEGVCSECGEFLIGTKKEPHLTLLELNKKWTGLVMSAPLNAPRCPKCKYSTFSDCNAGVDFLIDDGTNKIGSKEFFEDAQAFVKEIKK